MTDIYAPELWPKRRPRMYRPERDDFLRCNPQLDAAIIASDWGVTERWVIGYQRKLGVRLCKNSPRMYPPGWKRRSNERH